MAEFKKEWITQGITQQTVDWANDFGKELAIPSQDYKEKAPLTTAQLRRFFGEVKRIEMNVTGNKTDILMLKPMLAYAVGRDGSNGKKTRIDKLAKVLFEAISAIRVNEEDHIENDYSNFVNVFEAIVAYHKYYGGK